MSRLVRLAALACLLPAAAAAAQPPRADLVLVDGTVVTVDSQRPEAQAVAVRGDRIVAVGTDAEIRRCVGAGDARRGPRRPARHPRLHRGARPLHRARRVEARARPHEGAHVGRHRRAWSVRRRARRGPASGSSAAAGIRRSGRRAPQPNVDGVPLHASLDAVTPNNPVVLGHASGHASFVNGAMLRLAEHRTRHAEPRRRRDRARRERRARRDCCARRAQRLTAPRARAPAAALGGRARGARSARSCALAGADALSKGITSFHDAGSSFAHDRRLQAPRRRGAAAAAPLRHGARRVATPRSTRGCRSTDCSATATTCSRCARSSSRSTARSARTARGCSSRTPTCRRAAGSR